MRNLASSFTMRKDGLLPRGDWFRIENKVKESSADIYIYDEIGFWGTEASEFVQQLVALDAEKISLHLNSPGGEIFDGLAIYNALKQNKAEVTVYVDGLAASAASFIAQAGDKVIMARNAQMMIHDGIAMAYGNEADMRETAELLGKLSNNIADIYHQAANRRGAEENSEEYFRGLMRAELWMNGSEAVDFGLADEMTDADDDEAEAAKNKWDLSFYNSAGREKAKSPTRVAAEVALDTKEKEKSMGDTTPKATVDPEVTPAPVPEGMPPTEPVEVPETSETPAAEAPAAEAPAETPANKAGSQGVMINGKLVTDWSVINTHMQSLQIAQVEQTAIHRKNTVESFALTNKIPATQVDSLVALVNGDGDKINAMSDEQFAAFKASFESLPASPLFGSYATKTDAENNSSGFQFGTQPDMTADEKKDQISILQGTIAMHERTMSAEDVKKTKSYIELQTLLGDNNS